VSVNVSNRTRHKKHWGRGGLQGFRSARPRWRPWPQWTRGPGPCGPGPTPFSRCTSSVPEFALRQRALAAGAALAHQSLTPYKPPATAARSSRLESDGRRQRPAASKKPRLPCYEMTAGVSADWTLIFSDPDMLNTFFVK